MYLKVNNLSKNYGNTKAVDQVNFTIDKGEIVGFLGPNGAGKSTTMKMITGYLPPSSGSIHVLGHNIASTVAYKAKIGYLPEHNPLYGHMYVQEYIGYMASLNAMPKTNITTRVAEVIKQVGLGAVEHKTIKELSKGYRQRVGLAQALVHQPDILILDEPTTGLDPNHGRNTYTNKNRRPK
jgi:ABC-2 type transport system ATP-binding protein